MGRSRMKFKTKPGNELEGISDDDIDRLHNKKLELIDKHGNIEKDDESVSEDDRENVMDDFSSESEEEIDNYEDHIEIAKIGKEWGRKASDYIKQGELSDDEVFEDTDQEEIREDEEKEAIRIKKKQLKSLDKKSLDFMEESDSEEEKNVDNEAKDDVTLKITPSKTEKARKQANIEQIAEQAPELLGLLSEFNENVDKLQKQVLPLLEKLKDSELVTKDGNSYLEAKAHIMLSYCINIGFYLLLKAEGSSVKEHPVIEELVRMRTTIEKLKPLDMKLKNQFKKIIHKINENGVNGNFAASFKPEVTELTDEEDSDDGTAKHTVPSQRAYIVPKIASVPFEDAENDLEKEKRKEERLKSKARKSNLLRNLRDEVSDRPREEPAIGTEEKDSRMRDVDEERRKYEEEYFIRLRETKAEKKERRKREQRAQESMPNNFVEFENFSSIRQLVDESTAEDKAFVAESERQEALKQFMKKVELHAKSYEKKKTKPKRSGDELPESTEDPMLLARNAKPAESDQTEVTKNMETEEISAPSDKEDDFYKEVKRASRKRRQERKLKYTIEKKPMHNPADILREGEARSPGYKILKNRGLTAHKKREERNPRVKLRKKYEKKLKARKGQVREVRSSEALDYHGESSGLRTNLTRSRKIGK